MNGTPFSLAPDPTTRHTKQHLSFKRDTGGNYIARRQQCREGVVTPPRGEALTVEIAPGLSI